MLIKNKFCIWKFGREKIYKIVDNMGVYDIEVISIFVYIYSTYVSKF